jgi:hypothetical protein
MPREINPFGMEFSVFFYSLLQRGLATMPQNMVAEEMAIMGKSRNMCSKLPCSLLQDS